jgi:threonine synthase
MAFVSHLECSLTGERHEAGRAQGLSPAGRPLLVRYDLKRAGAAVTKRDLALRTGGFWRYRELLPMTRPELAPSLGEVMTPMIRVPRLEKRHGGGEWLVKDESRLPTGSFKARGLALAVAMAQEFGLKHLAMPTNGNAGAALSAYASRAGIRSTVLCPDDTPEVNVAETALQGADVWRVNGLINDCGKIVGEGKEKVGWFDVSTLKEPYRVEGKKTMGLEIAEQFGWELPDVILFPTGGGTAVIGMWKAFEELGALGWIGPKRPRMAVVQATGCAPLVKAWREGAEHAPAWPNAHTIAAGIRVPVAVGDFLILRAVRQSDGFCMEVEDADMIDARAEMAKEEGLLMCPEGAAAYAAVRRGLKDGLIRKSDRVVFFNCATGLKYPMAYNAKRLDRTKPIDWAQFH